MHYVKPLHRQHVQSAAVRSVGYDEADWLLQVEFADGKVCNYFRVPPEEHSRLRSAPALEAYLSREIEPYFESEEAETAHA